MKKQFEVKVVIKGKKVPDFGLGKGVLSINTITFTDTKNWGWKHPSFSMKKFELEDKLIKEVVKCTWKELKK